MEEAERAYNYFITHFIDREYGGVYWTVDFQGSPLNTKKQVYAVAFAIYELSEYFLASSNEYLSSAGPIESCRKMITLCLKVDYSI